MKRTILFAAAALAVLALAGEIWYQLYRREVRSQILQAYGAILTVEDYQGAGYGLIQADLAARAKLNALDSHNLAERDRQTVSCIAEFLSAMESLDSSQDIETTTLRTNIAEKAAVKASGCMEHLR